MRNGLLFSSMTAINTSSGLHSWANTKSWFHSEGMENCPLGCESQPVFQLCLCLSFPCVCLAVSTFYILNLVSFFFFFGTQMSPEKSMTIYVHYEIRFHHTVCWERQPVSIQSKFLHEQDRQMTTYFWFTQEAFTFIFILFCIFF